MKEVKRLSIVVKIKNYFSDIWKNSGSSIKFGSLFYAVTRIWLTLVSVFIYLRVPILSPSQSGGSYTDVIPLLTGWHGALLGMWQRWDTIHYQSIAQSGYSKSYLTAFFPGYPLLAQGVSKLLQISDLAALLLVSNIFAWLSLILLHQITRSLYDQKTTNLALLFLVAFPSSFFLFAGYPQSMLLFLILFCYWEAKQGNWLCVALAALLAGLTHGTIAPLSLMLAWQAYQTLKQTPFSLRWAIALVPFLPLGGIALFLSWRLSQGFEQYSSFMRQTWFRVYHAPWNALILGFNKLIITRDIVLFINCLLCLLIIFSVIWSIKKLPVDLNIYLIALMIFLFSTGSVYDPLKSLNRYTLVMFPVFIYLTVITQQNKLLRLGLLGFTMLFNFCFTYLFFTWRWVG